LFYHSVVSLTILELNLHNNFPCPFFSMVNTSGSGQSAVPVPQPALLPPAAPVLSGALLLEGLAAPGAPGPVPAVGLPTIREE
jgi:hypothetical protein